MGEAIKQREQQCLSQGGNAQDFHSELMKLRQRWRVKRIGSTITGDLTYCSGDDDAGAMGGKGEGMGGGRGARGG